MSRLFDAFAVTTPTGPHVTMQAGVIHLGRYWTTTSRTASKVEQIARTGYATAAVADGSAWRIVGGHTSILDPIHPGGLIGDPVSTALSGGAVLRLALAQIDSLRGHVLTGAPSRLLPQGRVIVATHLTDELVVDQGRVLGQIGRWADEGPGTRVNLPDRTLSPDPTMLPAVPLRLDHVPCEAAALVHQQTRAWLGLMSDGDAVPVPATWDPAAARAYVSGSILGALRVELPGPACLTLSDTEAVRPNHKVGIMLRGVAALTEMRGEQAEIGLVVEEVAHWEGFAAATQTAA